MARKEKEYKRLTRPRRSFGLASSAAHSLWLGKDHVLSLEHSNFREEYKRFYFRDIQAIITRKTVNGKVYNMVLGGFAAIFIAAIFLYAAKNPGHYKHLDQQILGGMIPGLPLLALLINWLRGPTCVCHLRTAVHTEALPSMNRLRIARKAINLLKPRIEEAQGALSREELEGNAAEMFRAAATATSPVARTVMKATPPPGP